MRLNWLVVVVYLAVCVVAFLISAGEGYLGTGSMVSGDRSRTPKVCPVNGEAFRLLL